MAASTRTSVTGEAPSTGAHQVKAPGGLGIRHLETLLMFLGLTTAYSLRVNMSVAIVAMADASTANPNMEEYDWDESTRSVILSSFFWGYVVTQVPAGQIAEKWSGRKLWSICMFICGLTNILIPVAAHYGGWGAVCACRVVMGLSQACVLPTVHTLMAKWAPPTERGRLGTYAYAGAQFGTVIALPICGWLAGSSWGWPSIFYIFGALTVVWSVAFFIWGADSPATHSSITPEERAYIEESLCQVEVRKKPPTQWKAIFTSVPMWALIIVHCGQNWGYWTLLTEIPSYMKAILLFDIQKNGLLSALPYLAMWLLSFPMCMLSDFALKRNWVSTGAARKICNTIGHWGPAIALIGLGYVTADQSVVAVIVLCFAVGLNAGSLCGYQINHIDLSPNFAGTMMAITNCIAGFMSIMAPLICGFIVTESSNGDQWRTVFFISAAIYFVCNLFFIIFGKGEVQPWNEVPEKSDSEDASKANNKSEK